MASLEAERDYYIDKLHENGYVSVDFPIEGSDIDQLFASFRALLGDIYDQPSQHGQHIIDAFAVELPGRPHDSKGFIEQRRVGKVSAYEIGRSPSTDNKDQMHFTPYTTEHVHTYLLHRGGTPRIVNELLSQCTAIHEAVKRSVRPAARALGLEDMLFAPKGMEHTDVHMLRVLRYLGNTASQGTYIAPDPLAELHFDRSRLTAAVWESASGLVGAPGNNAFGNPTLMADELDALAERAISRPITHRSKQAKVFAGAGYNYLPAELREASGNVPLLLHGVTDDRPGEERDAVVMFINQHANAPSWKVAPKQDTGFSDVRTAVVERMELVA